MIKKCTKCGVEKSVNDFNKDKSRASGYDLKCKLCSKEYMKSYYKSNKESLRKKQADYYKENKEKIKESSKKYRESNREFYKNYNKKYRDLNSDKLRKYKREYNSKRTKEDSIFKLKHVLRSRVAFIFKKNKLLKTKSLNDFLGCSWGKLKIYIENQFTEGMTWDNYGEWHLDHIIPLATAKTEEDVYRLNHFSNLQPLWASDNLKKGSNYGTNN